MSQGGMVFWKFWRQSYVLSFLEKKKKKTYQALANSTGHRQYQGRVPLWAHWCPLSIWGTWQHAVGCLTAAQGASQLIITPSSPAAAVSSVCSFVQLRSKPSQQLVFSRNSSGNKKPFRSSWISFAVQFTAQMVELTHDVRRELFPHKVFPLI